MDVPSDPLGRVTSATRAAGAQIPPNPGECPRECVGSRSAPTIARWNGRLDLDAYAHCLAQVKDTCSDETILRVTATPSTAFEEIVAVIAASAELGLDELFPDVFPNAPNTPQDVSFGSNGFDPARHPWSTALGRDEPVELDSP